MPDAERSRRALHSPVMPRGLASQAIPEDAKRWLYREIRGRKVEVAPSDESDGTATTGRAHRMVTSRRGKGQAPCYRLPRTVYPTTSPLSSQAAAGQCAAGAAGGWEEGCEGGFSLVPKLPLGNALWKLLLHSALSCRRGVSAPRLPLRLSHGERRPAAGGAVRVSALRARPGTREGTLTPSLSQGERGQDEDTAHGTRRPPEGRHGGLPLQDPRS